MIDAPRFTAPVSGWYRFASDAEPVLVEDGEAMADEDAIRERLAAATPAPWRLQNAETYTDAPTRFYIGSELRGIAETRRGNAQARADAVFIAHAPEDIAALLARVAELEEAWVDEHMGWSGGYGIMSDEQHDAARNEFLAKVRRGEKL